MTRCARRLAVLPALALALGVGCGTPAPPPTGTVACTFAVGGVPECYGYSNLNADEVNNAMIKCGAEPGVAFVSACPTTGLLGCCHESLAGVTLVDCTYGVPDDAGVSTMLETTCMRMGGTWMPTP